MIQIIFRILSFSVLFSDIFQILHFRPKCFRLFSEYSIRADFFQILLRSCVKLPQNIFRRRLINTNAPQQHCFTTKMDSIQRILSLKRIECSICQEIIRGDGRISSAGMKDSPSTVVVDCGNCSSNPLRASSGYKQGRVWVCPLCAKCNQRRSNMKCKCDEDNRVDESGGDANFNHDNRIADGESNNDSVDEDDESNVDDYDESDYDSNDDDDGNIPELLSRCSDHSDDENDDEDAGRVDNGVSLDIIMDGMEEINDIHGIEDEFHNDYQFDLSQHLTKENGWSKSSREYLIMEHGHPGFGKRSIMCQALLQIKNPTNSDCNKISDNQVNLHFHTAQVFHNSTKRERENICTVMHEERSKHEKETYNLKKAMEKSIRTELIGLRGIQIPHDTLETLIDDITKGAAHIHMTFKHPLGVASLPEIKTENDVRRYYSGGCSSIVSLLPCPDVTIERSSNGKEHARIHVKQLLNHVLAMCPTVCYYRAGYPHDWSSESYTGKHSYMAEVMNGSFFRDNFNKFHGMAERGEIPKETRIVMVRIWSDAFEAHKIAGNNEYNSVQVYTLRIRADPDDFIVPVRLSFKTKNEKSIILSIISEMKEFEQVHSFYWGYEQRIIPTIFVLDIALNDYPERCYNASISQGGTCSKRFGWSCYFDKSHTPSCSKCLNSRIDIILDGSCDNETIGNCDRCSDWWGHDMKVGLDEYPLPPDFNIREHMKSPPNVKLSFRMIERSLDKLEAWHIVNSKKTGATVVLTNYLQMLCIGGNNDLHRVMRQNQSVRDSDVYPEILKQYQTLDIELDFWTITVMHMFFLGVAKTTIKASNRMKLNNNGNDWWISLYNKMQHLQRHIMSLSIEWCPIMDFSAKKDKKCTYGTKGWMSRHCVGFSRISLIQYSFLDDISDLNPPEGYSDVIASFRRMAVVWFCLVANVFADVPAPARRIDHLVRLFLSSCLEFHEEGKNSDKAPFFIESPNYHSLLNCFEMLNKFGSLRYLWEGLDEKFIKYIKHEISILRRDTSHLKLLLKKFFRTSVLRDFNMNNPLQYVEKYYKRTNFKVYKRINNIIEEPSHVLEKEDVITGVIDEHGNFLICFTEGLKHPIKLYRLHFHDNSGQWMLNLWYSHVSLGDKTYEASDRKVISDSSSDCFMLVRHEDHSIGDSDNLMHGMRTAICQSWRVRVNDGNLSLPMPREEFLRIYNDEERDTERDSSRHDDSECDSDSSNDSA